MLKVISISSNANSFGLSGHVLLDTRTGEAWQAARSRCGEYPEKLAVGQMIGLHKSGSVPDTLIANSFEIPRLLGKMPPGALAEAMAIPEKGYVKGGYRG